MINFSFLGRKNFYQNVVKNIGVFVSVLFLAVFVLDGVPNKVQAGHTTGPSVAQFQYIKWEIVKRKGSSNSIQASEFRTILNGVAVLWPVGSSATNPGGNNPGSEGPEKVIDSNLNTKWLDFAFSAGGQDGSSVLVVDVGAGQTVLFNSYHWATANDEVGRDPISWNVYGSNDGENWILLDVKSDQTVPEARSTYTDDYTLDNYGLVGHWKFDEAVIGDAGSVVDSSGYNNHGTPEEGSDSIPIPSADVPGINFSTRSLSFNNSGNYVNVGTDSSLNLGSTFTLAAWVKVNSFPNAYSFIIAKDGDNGLSYDLGFSNNGKPYVAINDGGWGEYTAVNTLSTGVWHHIAGVRSSDNKLKLYIDGVLTREFTDVKVPQVDGDTPVTLGKRSFADDDLLYDGLIDDARVFTRALSAEEVAALAEIGGGEESDDFAGGVGNEGNPYQIETCQQLQNINLELDAYFILNDDIDCAETEDWNEETGFDPIGSVDEGPTYNNFLGVLDGQNYKITNLYINRVGEDDIEYDYYVGLFSIIGDCASFCT